MLAPETVYRGDELMSLAPLELVSARPAEDGQLRYRGGQQSFRADCRQTGSIPHSVLQRHREGLNILAGAHTALAAAGGRAPVDRGMIDRCNQALRGYLLGARGFIEARSQVGGDSRRALSRS